MLTFKVSEEHWFLKIQLDAVAYDYLSHCATWEVDMGGSWLEASLG
jgi:hypothetical protein